MLGQQPGEKYWSLDDSKKLVKGARYLFIVAAPANTVDCCGAGTASDQLTQFGWGDQAPGIGMSFSAPPEAYKQAMQVLVSQNLPTPQIWQVIATWNGADGAVLPAKTSSGSIYFGPIFVENTFVGPPPAPEPQPQPTPVQPPVVVPTSKWPSVIGFFAGALIIGGAWWYARSNYRPALKPALGREGCCGG